MLYSGGDFQAIQPPSNFPGLVQPSVIESRSSCSSASSSSSDSLEANDQHGSSLGFEGFRIRPGLAMSQDGRNWARIEADHHSGALLDVGAPGDWDALFISSPQVRKLAHFLLLNVIS
jgi:hypothetical protein